MQKPGDQAREKIDKLLTDSGWTIQNRSTINFSAARGVAVREALHTDKHDRLTAKVRWEQFDENAPTPNELDRAIANSQRMRSTTRGLLPKFKQNATALRD